MLLEGSAARLHPWAIWEDVQPYPGSLMLRAHGHSHPCHEHERVSTGLAGMPACQPTRRTWPHLVCLRPLP